jgi:hypothetical protein
MTKKPILILALVAVVGGVVLYLNRDWFSRAPIQISHRFHAFAGRFGGQTEVAPVMFEFNRLLKLTDVKVILVQEAATNKFPKAFWHMVSESNSLPTRGFVYGQSVPGMRPATKGVNASPLDPDATYRVLLRAGSFRAEHDFSLNQVNP